MPRPTSATTIQRPDLGPGLLEYIESQEDFIGLKAMPIINVAEQAADYPVIPLEALLEIPETKRRPRGNYSRSDWEFETDTYSCGENGWEEVVDDTEAALYDRYFDVEQICANRAMGIIMRNQEKRIADMLFNATNFSATSITHEWDDGTNAVPITDVNTGHLAIKDATGLRANTLIIAYSTFLNLGVNAQILDRIKYTFPDVKKGQITREMLAEAFSVDQVLVGGGRYNSAIKGQTASLTGIWSNEYAMLCRVSNSPDVTEPCVGRTFLWTGDSPSNAVVESYRSDEVRGDVIRVRHNTDEELIITAAAYLMDNITT